jgi:hypothetical protein
VVLRIKIKIVIKIRAIKITIIKIHGRKIITLIISKTPLTKATISNSQIPINRIITKIRSKNLSTTKSNKVKRDQETIIGIEQTIQANQITKISTLLNKKRKILFRI